MTQQKPQYEEYEQPDRYDPNSNAQGRWIYEKHIGSGAYGDVWKAYDRCKETVVSLKVCRRRKSHQAAWISKVAAFQMHREASVSINMLHNPTHPKYDADKAALLVRYLEDHTRHRYFTHAETDAQLDPEYDWDNSDVVHTADYVVMEYLDYTTVRELLKLESFPRRLIHNVACKTAQAIEYLQSFDPPIIHRDVRVHNIMAKGTHVKLIDFGLVVACQPSFEVNPNSAVYVKYGKQQYWAPTEVRAAWNHPVPLVINYARPTHSFDIYSLGALCVEMLSDPKTFYKNISTRGLSVSACTINCWKSLGLAPETFKAMLSIDPRRRPTPCVVYKQLTSNAALRIAPLGEMTNQMLRHSAVAKFVNLAHDLCVSQQEPDREKIRWNIFGKLVTAMIPIMRGQPERMHACLDHILNLVRVDDCVRGHTAYQNYLLINEFIEYALRVLVKKSTSKTHTAALTGAKRKENQELCVLFVDAMRSTHPGRCTPFIEALWGAHACTPAEPRASQCLADIVNSCVQLCPELGRFVEPQATIPLTVRCPDADDEANKNVPSKKRSISLVSTSDDDDSAEGERDKIAGAIRPGLQQPIESGEKRHKGNALTRSGSPHKGRP